MATRIHDQELVEAFGKEHGFRADGLVAEAEEQPIARVVACFGMCVSIDLKRKTLIRF